MMTTMAALLGALPLAIGAGHRLGAAPPPRYCNRRRAAVEPIPDALHDPGHLSRLFLASATVPAPTDPAGNIGMNPFSAPIERPVATTLLALGVLLLGVVAYTHMPIDRWECG